VGNLYVILVSLLCKIACGTAEIRSLKVLCAHIGLILLTLGLYTIPFIIIIGLELWRLADFCRKHNKFYVRWCGHVIMSIITLTLYAWWNLLVMYTDIIKCLWKQTRIEQITEPINDESNEIIINKETKNTPHIIVGSHLLLALMTGGLYIVFQLFYQISTNIEKAHECMKEPYDSKLYQQGLNIIYVLSLGTFWLWRCWYGSDKIKRYGVKSAFLILNLLAYGLIYKYIILKLDFNPNYVLWLMILINYATFATGDRVFHNNQVRYVIYVLSQKRKKIWNSFTYGMYNHVGYNMSTTYIMFANWISQINISIGNSWRQMSADWSNNHYSISYDIISSSDPEYVGARIVDFAPTDYPTKVTFDEVKLSRETNPKYILRKNCEKSCESLQITKSLLIKKYSENFGYSISWNTLMFAERVTLSEESNFIKYDIANNITVNQYVHAKEMFNRDIHKVTRTCLDKHTFAFDNNIYIDMIDEYDSNIVKSNSISGLTPNNATLVLNKPISNIEMCLI